jgi:hypothetical protein
VSAWRQEVPIPEQVILAMALGSVAEKSMASFQL